MQRLLAQPATGARFERLRAARTLQTAWVRAAGSPPLSATTA